AARNQIGAEVWRRTMRATRTQRARLLVTIGMAVVLTACTRPSPPDQSTAPRAATAPATAATPPAVPAPALAPEARAGRGEVVVTLFHETHLHGGLLGLDYQGQRADGR